MGVILLELIGGLGLFIAGMNMMSRGIEKVAGSRLRAILEAFTKNKFLGLIVGMFFTAAIQSSSAATVMVVSFVNSGLMKLTEACGIILGANIGTTVTAMLVAFKLSAVAPLFIFAGAIMVNFMKKPMVRKSGEVVLGFGILFMGISAMSSAMASLRDIPKVIDMLANFTNPVLGVLLGLVITSVVQSSSVTVSILVVMASQGLVDLRICMFVILGCNIGACTSAVLASLSGNKNAKRTALIHLLFNVFGTILMFVLLIFFSDYIIEIVRVFSGHGNDSGNLGRNIAWSHFLFKVFQVIILYPFMDLVIKLTYKIIPGEDEKLSDDDFHLDFISDHILPDPTVAIPIAVQEMSRMAHMAFSNLNLSIKCLIENDKEDMKKVEATEKYIDYLSLDIPNLVKWRKFPSFGFTKTLFEQSMGGQFEFFEKHMLHHICSLKTLDDLLLFYNEYIGDMFGRSALYPCNEKSYVYLYKKDYASALAELNTLRDRVSRTLEEEQKRPEEKRMSDAILLALTNILFETDKMIDEIRCEKYERILEGIHQSILRWDAELKMYYPCFYTSVL